ncbi:MAG: TSUP family transporter, partial [Bdellovibrionales bacterium]|nr:TSUP family transporter [Bdellovibrionales bacterium]
PRIGEVDRHHYLKAVPFYLIFGSTIGFYDGFFGPGTGSFWALALVTVLGFNLLKATAHTKMLNFTSNFASFLFFVLAGYVSWQPAVTMAVGQLLGARLGANTALKHGTGIIKPLLVIMSLVMTTKLIYDQPENVIHIWIRQLLF